VYVKAIKTEEDAARYIRDVTQAMLESHEDAERIRRTPKRKRVLEIAAVADQRSKPKRARGKSASKRRKSRAKRKKK
jgi:hypothetical protein